MKQVNYPKREEWNDLFLRPVQEQEELGNTIRQVFRTIAQDGDAGVLKYTQQYDYPEAKVISTVSLADAGNKLSDELKNAIQLAQNNISKFHSTQIEHPIKLDTMPGVTCWRESRPIDRIGIYIPGGSAPLFSTVLMLAIPAQLAGCRDVILCTPPDRNGNIDPAILYAAYITGVSKVFAIGGAQAIAAMAIGTSTISRVDKIFGPGNQYVTAAKTYAQQLGIAIDMPAGPSEVLIIADKHANPAFVAADLLSQAEHGADSQAILLSDSKDTIDNVLSELSIQLSLLPRKAIAQQALQNSRAILLSNLDECIDFSNGYAPEHLIIATENAEELADKVNNAGSVFIGKYSCESAGDYASGTNHTLPTNGYARNYSGVSVDSFLKKITFQRITAEGIFNIGPAIETLAAAEGLIAHKEAVTIRLNALNNIKK
ncbi:MAG: histidinol dehydrogenase [Bacteroidetes bacterium 43-93]|nr:histidinol dehydrogenase [Bacteroidota bacterium]OJW98914.1 MAG: histidinol dehydrogenase [Bacteroidetes bacterium 43-93]